MGISSRDYVRDSSSGGYSGRGFTSGGSDSGWKWIIGITVAVFVLQLLFTRPLVEVQEDLPENLPPEVREFVTKEAVLYESPRVSVVEQWLELDPQLVMKGQIWRVFTYCLCHDRRSVWHIVFNMFWLFWMGRSLEQMYGTREFVLFYIAGAGASGCAFLLLSLLLHDPIPAIGASGAVMAVMMLAAIHFPRQTIFIWFFPVELRWLVAFYLVYDLLPVLRALGGDGFRDGVAHAAHLGGLAFGFVYYKQQWRLEGLWERLRLGKLRGAVRSRVSRPKVKIYEPSVPQQPTENFDAQVDTILAKIHEQGETSLTDEEREVLKNASRRYKKR